MSRRAAGPAISFTSTAGRGLRWAGAKAAHPHPPLRILTSSLRIPRIFAYKLCVE